MLRHLLNVVLTSTSDHVECDQITLCPLLLNGGILKFIIALYTPLILQGTAPLTAFVSRVYRGDGLFTRGTKVNSK